MRSKMYQLFLRYNDISAIWDNRNVADATAEPEWEEFENLLYIIAEFVHGDRTFKGV